MADPRRFDWLRARPRDEDAPLSAEARFADALAQLPAQERSALALSELGGLEPDEIARRLGVDRRVAEDLLDRARGRVRAALAGRGRLLGALLPLQGSWPGSFGSALRLLGAVAIGTAGLGSGFDGSRVLPPDRAPSQANSDQEPVAAPAPAAPRGAASAPARIRFVVGATANAGLALPRAAAAPPTVSARPAGPEAAPDAPFAQPEHAAESPGQVDGPPSLDLVGVVAIAARHKRPDGVHGTVLHLPDVAELVRDQVVGSVGAPKQDRPDERVAVVAAQAGQAEEPRSVDDPNALDPNAPWVAVEAVEARLGTDEPSVRASASAPKAG